MGGNVFCVLKKTKMAIVANSDNVLHRMESVIALSCSLDFCFGQASIRRIVNLKLRKSKGKLAQSPLQNKSAPFAYVLL